MPLQGLRDRGDLGARLLDPVLGEAPLTGGCGLEHGFGREGLRDRQQPHLLRLASATPGRAVDPLANCAQAVRDHAGRTPKRASSGSTTSMGSPITFERDPSIDSTKRPASP